MAYWCQANFKSFYWHEANSFSESMEDPHRWSEAADQCPISVAIFFEVLLSFLKELKNILGRFGEFELGGERVVSEVDPGFLGIIDKGIEDQLEGRRRDGCVRRGSHESDGYSARSEG
jgi:hypothetical protein